jgi:hypothetical protein
MRGRSPVTLPDQRELLAQSAPLALRWADECCRPDPRTGERCDWSHGLWQVLRLMELVVSPQRHDDFYRAAFAGVEGVGGARPRVLVSGTADYAMPALALECFRARGVEPELTVLDRCETPVRLSDWYAQQAGALVQGVVSDILDYVPAGDAAGGFDAICTDSFFGRFAPAERPGLVAKWASLLRPGGLLVTVNVLRAGGGASPVGFDAAQALAFRESVAQRAASLPPGVSFAPGELARRATDYASHHGSHPLASLAELRALFDGAGFALPHLEQVQAGDPSGRATGPSVRGPRRYARVIAMRA